MINIHYKRRLIILLGLEWKFTKQPGNGFSEIGYKDVSENEFKQNGLFYKREKSIE